VRALFSPLGGKAADDKANTNHTTPPDCVWRATALRYATAGARCRRIFLPNPSRSNLTLGPPRRHARRTAFPLARVRRDRRCRIRFVRNRTFWQRRRRWLHRWVPPCRKRVGQNNDFVCARFFPHERLSRFYGLKKGWLRRRGQR